MNKSLRLRYNYFHKIAYVTQPKDESELHTKTQILKMHSGYLKAEPILRLLGQKEAVLKPHMQQ